MSNAKRIQVNLASQPLRNHRFFVSLISAAAVVFVLLIQISGLIYVNSRQREGDTRAALAKTQKMIESSQRERNDWNAQVRDLSKKEKERIDAVNGIIAKKAFSWVEFFSELEDALPPGSHVSWMAPLQAGENKLDVRFKIVSQNLTDLLALIQRLNGLGFKRISVRNETSVGSELTSEISFSHERTL